MISVASAREIVFSQVLKSKIDSVDFDKSMGFVLAEDIVADRAMPPFNRVTMDGIAINYNDFEIGIKEWRVTKIQYAGEEASGIEEVGTCVEVMTGAVLPLRCDTVIRYEDLNEFINDKNEKCFAFIEKKILRGQNIHKLGSDKSKGDIVLKKGQKLAACDIALLASVGKMSVLVHQKINVAVIATGDELTKVEEFPNEYQIRASNQHLIAAALHEININCVKFLRRDDLSDLKELLEKCLKQYDVVVITGAVSKGKADFIPATLKSLKVAELFHGVEQRPAKPFWFGRKEQCLVFAMPGNPVSAALCTYVYLIPYLTELQGFQNVKHMTKVCSEVVFKPSLNYFMQAKVCQDEQGNLYANAFQGNGSGDLTNLAEINAFVELPANEEYFDKNKLYRVYFTRNIIYPQP
jgi:molybdopterin molybdotransferase